MTERPDEVTQGTAQQTNGNSRSSYSSSEEGEVTRVGRRDVTAGLRRSRRRQRAAGPRLAGESAAEAGRRPGAAPGGHRQSGLDVGR